MSTRTSAKAIGNNDARSAEYAVGIRKDWLKATNNPEKQAEIAADFKIGYIAGREKVSLAEAQAIFEAGKGKGATKAGIQAIDRATSAWNYHVVQAKAKKTEPQSHGRVAPKLREAAMAFLSEFEGETLSQQITAAIKTLQALR